jgi:hypothetical protein
MVCTIYSTARGTGKGTHKQPMAIEQRDRCANRNARGDGIQRAPPVAWRIEAWFGQT